MIFGFGWIVFRYGITFVQDFGDDLMETIPFTNNWYYPAMPVGGFLIMVFSLNEGSLITSKAKTMAMTTRSIIVTGARRIIASPSLPKRGA